MPDEARSSRPQARGREPYTHSGTTNTPDSVDTRPVLAHEGQGAQPRSPQVRERKKLEVHLAASATATLDSIDRTLQRSDIAELIRDQETRERLGGRLQELRAMQARVAAGAEETIAFHDAVTQLKREREIEYAMNAKETAAAVTTTTQAEEVQAPEPVQPNTLRVVPSETTPTPVNADILAQYDKLVAQAEDAKRKVEELSSGGMLKRWLNATQREKQEQRLAAAEKNKDQLLAANPRLERAPQSAINTQPRTRQERIAVSREIIGRTAEQMQRDAAPYVRAQDRARRTPALESASGSTGSSQLTREQRIAASREIIGRTAEQMQRDAAPYVRAQDRAPSMPTIGTVQQEAARRQAAYDAALRDRRALTSTEPSGWRIFAHSQWRQQVIDAEDTLSTTFAALREANEALAVATERSTQPEANPPTAAVQE